MKSHIGQCLDSWSRRVRGSERRAPLQDTCAPPPPYPRARSAVHRPSWTASLPTMHIRPATPDDIPALNALIERSARDLSRGFYRDDEIASAIRYVFGVDSSLVADGTYYVISDGDSTLGCGGWSRRRALYGRDDATVGSVDELLDPARDPARIRAFFVAPEAARRGVGRALLDECVRAARDAGFTSLELMATLPGAPFYRSQGFVDVEAGGRHAPRRCRPAIHPHAARAGPRLTSARDSARPADDASLPCVRSAPPPASRSRGAHASLSQSGSAPRDARRRAPRDSRRATPRASRGSARSRAWRCATS